MQRARFLALLLMLAHLPAIAGEVLDFPPQTVTVRGDGFSLRFDCNVTGLDLFPGAYAMRLSCFNPPAVLPASVEPVEPTAPEWSVRASFYHGGQPLTFAGCRLVGYEFDLRSVVGEIDCRHGEAVFVDGFDGFGGA